MHLVLGPILAVVLLAAAGEANAATCRKTTSGPARTIAAPGDPSSHVTVCDRRRGRATIVARGGRYTDVWAAGRHLAYVEVRVRPGPDVVVATVLRARTLRVVRRAVRRRRA